MPDLNELRAEGERAIAAAGTTAELEELRVRLLGRKSDLTATLRSIGELPPAERGPVGKQANEVRQALEGLLAGRTAELQAAELDRRLAEDRIDVTLPGDPPLPSGHLHLVTQIRRRMEDIFVGLGFTVLEGPEIEYDYYNFTALNHPPEHPARLPQDTFYLADSVLLRTHTSPMQVRAMEAQAPPIYIVVPGRVYRPDTPDATHVPMFWQLEGLAIDEDITLADLQGVLLQFARQMFGEDTRVRLRPGYFPFTEPSVEVDVSCFRCGGTGWEGAGRCGTCKGEAWIEILGSGMVDPNVLDYVAATGYDNERVQGFAFGMGIERIASIVHEVPDLRMLYENDLRLLEQFGAGA
jgi:phenylalanyl-tRNA synthetase alpha chain